jgi:phosphohistidine swiveling domain-containing protein
MTATAKRAQTFSGVAERSCVPLAAESERSLVGGKAHALGAMLRLGVRVPAGFVITTRAFAAHLEENALTDRIERLCQGLTADDPARLTEASAAIATLVRGASLAPGLREELLHSARPLLREGPVVVRSSAVGEDSSSGSFAGQLDSVLHVATEAELERALFTCWASYWSERALFYRVARGATLDGMGVVVQPQVAARASGVMFSDAGAGGILVEYGPGLADALVAGAIDPGQITIDPVTRSVTRHAAAPESAIDDLVLSAQSIAALADAASRLERSFGAPQDIEWAMDGGNTLFIVQSRPITAPVPWPDRPSSSRSQAPAVHWSNANVNENYPDPVSPLLYSIATAGYTCYFRNLARAFGIAPARIAAMEPAFRQIIGQHGARIYYNLTSIHSILRLAPFGEALAASFDSFVGADGPAMAASQRRGFVREAWETVVVAMKTAWQYRSLGTRIRRFERTVDAFAARTHPDRLNAAPLQQLRGALDEFMDIRCNRWLDASLADAAAMVCYGALQRLLTRVDPAGEHGAVHTSLLKAIPDVVSGEPVHALWALSRATREDVALSRLFQTGETEVVLQALVSEPRFAAFQQTFAEYLERWGFRCSSELMLTAPSFQEDAAPLLEMLRAYARLDGDSPSEALARQAAEREALTARLTQELTGRPVWGRLPFPTCAQLLRLLLPWTHAAIRFRERARLKQALLYSRCRRIALVLGERLAARGLLLERDDVFWLSIDELRRLAAEDVVHPQAILELVETRAREHRALAATTPPDAFVLADGESLPARSTDPAAAAGEFTALAGLPACGGRVTGRATVLGDVTEAARLARGDVLVTRQTDPGWAPVFFLIAGLVIERGGMLSHGAIIAREFGIPCVVAVRGATQVIPDGATITVDGDHGHVSLAD